MVMKKTKRKVMKKTKRKVVKRKRSEDVIEYFKSMCPECGHKDILSVPGYECDRDWKCTHCDSHYEVSIEDEYNNRVDRFGRKIKR